MGRIVHDAVLVTLADYIYHNPPSDLTVPDIEAFREALPSDFKALLVGPITAPTNGYIHWIFLPDGSKEGWDASNEGDRYRDQFVDLFRDMLYDDGSTPADVVSITYGETDWGAVDPFGRRKRELREAARAGRA